MHKIYSWIQTHANGYNRLAQTNSKDTGITRRVQNESLHLTNFITVFINSHLLLSIAVIS